jgi:terminase small subunit-like protein
VPKLKNRRREHFAVEVASMTPPDRAYVLAGFKDSEWSRYNAHKLAHDPAVEQRIEELRTEFREHSQLHAEWIQRQLLPLVEANPQDLFAATPDPTGRKVEKLRPITDIPRRLAAAIQRIKLDPETGAVTEISLYPKTEAGNTLLRSVGGLVDRLEVNNPAQMSDADLVGEFAVTLEQLGVPPATIEQIKKGIEMSLGIIDGTAEPIEASILAVRHDPA